MYYRPEVKREGSDSSVQALASTLGRTPDSVAMKLHNFEAVDQSVSKKALENTGRLDGVVFENFSAKPNLLRDEAERISTELAELGRTSDQGVQQELDQISRRSYRVEDSEVLTRVRRGQAAFSKVIRKNYRSECAICGIDFPELLVASHIKPWADDPDRRLDPANGLCLCVLHDRLFDKGLIGVSAQMRVLISKELRASSAPIVQTIVSAVDGVHLKVPATNPPDGRLLEYHRQAIFRGM